MSFACAEWQRACDVSMVAVARPPSPFNTTISCSIFPPVGMMSVSILERENEAMHEWMCDNFTTAWHDGVTLLCAPEEVRRRDGWWLALSPRPLEPDGLPKAAQNPHTAYCLSARRRARISGGRLRWRRLGSRWRRLHNRNRVRGSWLHWRRLRGSERRLRGSGQQLRRLRDSCRRRLCWRRRSRMRRLRPADESHVNGRTLVTCPQIICTVVILDKPQAAPPRLDIEPLCAPAVDLRVDDRLALPAGGAVLERHLRYNVSFISIILLRSRDERERRARRGCASIQR